MRMFTMIIIGVFLAVNSSPALIFGWAVAVAGCFLFLLGRADELAIPRGLAHLLIFPLLLMCVGLPGIYQYPLREIVRDLWYFSGPVVYISFGYLAFERLGRWQQVLQPLLVISYGVALYSVILVFVNRNELAQSSSVNEYRNMTSIGSTCVLCALILLILIRQSGLVAYGIERSTIVRRVFYAVATASIFLSLSRTLILMFIAGIALSIDIRKLPNVLKRRGIVIGVLVILGVGGIISSNTKITLLDSFAEKILNSGDEVKVHAYETFEDINNNWRGFEAYRALQTYKQMNSAQKIFGGGLGTKVDLGFAMDLGDSEHPLRYIPILHNGYMFLLVKTGLLGMGLFVAFLVQILIVALRSIRIPDPVTRASGFLLVWIVLVILMTQGVVTGIYNKGVLAPQLLLLGCAWACLSNRQQWRASTRTVGALTTPSLSSAG